ncbi:MAG: hypothetical protein JXB38_12765 [Anaerolineales bacterium]|nr:hypothetical protein [Anaerolineales bacterium]
MVSKDLQNQIVDSFQKMGQGKGMISPSVYDIAWLARLNEDGVEIGKEALEWLRQNQLEDGSWGEAQIPYSHERFINTLAAAVTLARQSDKHDRQRLEKAVHAINKYALVLQSDPLGETIGFEMIAPSLLNEAQNLGLLHSNYPYLEILREKRAAKIAALPQGFVNRKSTVVFSSEMLQEDEYDLLDLDDLQESNGSIGCSPAATVWYLKNVSNESSDLTLNFLHRVMDDNGMAPYIAPIDVFETAWSLWNIAITGELTDEIIAASQPLLDFLEQQWNAKGLSAVSEFPVPDGDTTAMVYDALTMFGRSVDIEGLLSFQGPAHFYCYRIEANASISTNVHVLSALRQAGLTKNDPIVTTVRNYLSASRLENSYWNDKWHISPYYTTSHAVIAAAGYDSELSDPAAHWLLANQDEQGGWGFYLPTAEETAYALQALAIWKQHGGNIPADTIQKGRTWLIEHANDVHPFLWIGKSLYMPTLVIETAIQSALAITEQV